MTRNSQRHPARSAPDPDPAIGTDRPDVAAILERLDGRSLALVGMMGSGKTTIGRRLAAKLGLAFVDSDAEIERASGRTVSELFGQYGESEFRTGERRVIARLLGERQAVIATGGGAVTDAETRTRLSGTAVSIWLDTPLATLVRRVSGRTHRPLLDGGDVAATLGTLLSARRRHYAASDVTVPGGDTGADQTTDAVLRALAEWREARRVRVPLGEAGYDVMIGADLLSRAGGLLGRVIGVSRAVIVADAEVAHLHLSALADGFTRAGLGFDVVTFAPGEAAKSIDTYQRLCGEILALGIDRRCTIVALGGGVAGDLAGFLAATLLRGLPFVQIPTTLLAQVDSSVGGKTGINSPWGKNLIGAFHQPRLVLADTRTLATLPRRERAAGYAEIVKAGLVADAALFEWCEQHGTALLAGDRDLVEEAVERACAFKAAIVADDEREQSAQGGRALLNLGHTFGHALEAELGFDGRLLHGEAVAIGCRLAFSLASAMGLCDRTDLERMSRHLESVGLDPHLSHLPVRLSATRLIAHMARDKKALDGRLVFVLPRAIGHATVERAVPRRAVADLLVAEGCEPD